MGEIELYTPPPELVAKVLSLSRDGLTRTQIHGWAEDLPEKPTKEAIDAAIAQSAIELASAGNISSDVEAGRSIARLHDLYARLHQTGDLRGCLSVQKELTRMLGLANSASKHQSRKVEAMKRTAMRIVDIAERYIPKSKATQFIEEIRECFESGGA